jgi:hypothetical protein
MFPGTEATSGSITWYDLDGEGHIVQEELVIHRDPRLIPITGEASANTFAQVQPQRVYRAFPKAKLFVCLRHPVDRAYAHYRMLQRFAAEGRRLPIDLRDFHTDFKADFAQGEHSVFAVASLYCERLKKWAGVFGMGQIHVIRSEDLRDRLKANRVMQDVCSFLGIERFDFTEVLDLTVNVSAPSALAPELREELYAFYREDVAALESFLDRELDWDG